MAALPSYDAVIQSFSKDGRLEINMALLLLGTRLWQGWLAEFQFCRFKLGAMFRHCPVTLPSYNLFGKAT